MFPPAWRQTRPGTFDSAGPPGSKVRYTPVTAGKHRLVLKVTDRSGNRALRPLEFEATAGQAPGFVRVARQSPRYFAFDGGRPYFAVGENMCWAGGRDARWPTTPRGCKGLGDAGGNWARLWLAYNEKGLEWMPAPTPEAGHRALPRPGPLRARQRLAARRGGAPGRATTAST